MSPLAEKLQAHQGLIAARSFDHGCSLQFWLLDMTAEEFEAWWLAQPTFEDNPDGLLDEAYQRMGRTPPPHSKFTPPGTFLIAQSEADVELWRQFDSRPCYHANLCCEHDSFLDTPDGHRLYHKGSTEPDKIPRSTKIKVS